MARKQRKYTEEFRREAVRLMESNGKAVAQIECYLGVNDSVLYRWRDVYGQSAWPEGSPNGRNVAELEAEVKRLQREKTMLWQKRDVLKRLSASSARKSRELPGSSCDA